MNDILDNATPRPWRVAGSENSGTQIRISAAETMLINGETWETDEAFFTDDGSPIAHCPDLHPAWGDGEANAQLIVTAVNAYESHQEVIRELIEAMQLIAERKTPYGNKDAEFCRRVARNALNLAKEEGVKE